MVNYKRNPRKIDEVRMDTVTARSPTPLLAANIRADSAVGLEDSGGSIGDVFRAQRRDNHFARRAILSEEDGPFTYCGSRKLVPSGVGFDVVIAFESSPSRLCSGRS